MDGQVSADELVRVVARLERTIDRLQDTYVMQSIYARDVASNERRFSEIERNIQQDRADRKTTQRLVITSFVFPLALLIINLVFLARGGGL